MTSYALFQHLLFAFAIAVISAVATGLLVRHLRVIDVPNDRSSHSTPTPRGGGLAIVGGFLFGLALIRIYAYADPLEALAFMGFLAALLIVALVALYDDVCNGSVKVKFASQFLAIGVVMVTGSIANLKGIPALAWLGTAGGAALTFIWMLGLTNAYNFMDGLDGMAAGTAAVVSGFFCAISYQQGSPFIHVVALAICAASLGFLVFNRPPAKIFMGDVGSTFLGFSFAVLAILAAQHDPSRTSLLVMPLLLFHYLFDTVFTFCRRLLAGENVFQAHRSHLYQLLNRSGASHLQVSLLYAAMAAVQGLAAMHLAEAAPEQRLWFFLPFCLLYALYAAWIMRLARQHGLLQKAR